MKILITGASGFVGGALWRCYRRLGWETIGLGRQPLVESDYRVHDLAQPLELGFKPDVVVHAAARSSPWGNRHEYERQNVLATENVRTFCQAVGNPRLIYLSTSAVFYRNEHQYEMTEETSIPAESINEYARTKYLGEQVVREYSGPWCILRPRAVFGPGDTVVFPRVIRAAKAGRLPIIESDETVWGDLIYIDTLVEYIVRAIDRRATGSYNLTNHQPVPILAFLSDVLSRLGLSLPSKRLSAKRALRLAATVEGVYRLMPFLGEPPITRFGVSVFAYSKTFNVAKMLGDLGTPAVALDEGTSRFIAWQKEQP